MNRLDELISRFLDDDLSPEERLELQHAIEADSRGADELLAYYQQDRLLSALLRPASADAVNAILAAVSAEDGFVDSVMRQARATAAGNTFVHVPEKMSDDPATEAKPRTQPAATPSDNWFDRLFPRPRWAFAVAVVALIGLLVWLFPSVNNQPTLTVATGTRVTLERNGQSFPAQDRLELLPGDLLRISGSNGAAISYGNEITRVTLNDHTEVKTLAWQKGKRFELRLGELEATVARQRPFEAMVLLTAQAEARVLGTKFTLTTTTNATRLEVAEGKVKLTRKSDGTAVKVPAGYYAVAATATELSVLPQTGSILREYWTNLPGSDVNELLDNPDYPDRPSGRDYVDLLEVPAAGATNYGCRLAGFLHPPVTGQYIFWIAASPAAAVNLSKDENPANAVRIFGNHFDFGRGRESKPREWERKADYARTKSQPITLVAGRRYYVEAIHKADDRVGHLAIAWTPPGGEREIIAGKYLSPLKPKPKEKKP